MEEWKDRALLIRLGHFHERDLWVKLLLPSRGLFTAFAFGGAVSRRRFCGCLDVFNEIECRIRVSSRGRYLNLEEATLLSAPLALRKDWNLMGQAANCLCFTEALGIGSDSSGECYSLLKDLRDLFETTHAPSAFIPVFFRLRMAAALGLSPDFLFCASCGAKLLNGGFFQVDEGRSLCHPCSKNKGFLEKRRGMMLSNDTLALLNDIQRRKPSEWAGLSYGECRQAARAIEGFVQFHLGIAWENGTFRRV